MASLLPGASYVTLLSNLLHLYISHFRGLCLTFIFFCKGNISYLTNWPCIVKGRTMALYTILRSYARHSIPCWQNYHYVNIYINMYFFKVMDAALSLLAREFHGTVYHISSVICTEMLTTESDRHGLLKNVSLKCVISIVSVVSQI